MDRSFQAPGAYVPYMSYPYGTFVATGSPSPTPSLCSEPIYQTPLPDGPCASPGIQTKNPKMQLLNTNMVDARRKNSMIPRVQHRVEPPMMNFFQTGITFSDHLSDSDVGSMNGSPVSSHMSPHSIQGCQITPQMSHHYCFMSPYQYQQSTTPIFQYPFMNQPAEHLQSKKTRMTYPQPDVSRSSERKLEDQRQEQEYSESVSSRWDTRDPVGSETEQYPPEGNAESSASSDEASFQPGLPRKETKGQRLSSSVRKHLKRAGKKGLISTREDLFTEDRRRKRKIMVRKLRKKVQQKNKSLHKTELCTQWALTSTCTYKGKCYFAHGIEELKNRSRVGNFKTQPCVDCPIAEGRCMFGSRCNYCHPGEALRRAFRSMYFDTDYYFNLRNEFPNNDYPFGIFV